MDVEKIAERHPCGMLLGKYRIFSTTSKVVHSSIVELRVQCNVRRFTVRLWLLNERRSFTMTLRVR